MTDDISVFSKVFNVDESRNVLTSGKEKISLWGHQQKMQFNPDPNEPANEIIFSNKLKDISDPSVINNEIKKILQQKHPGVILVSKLNFNSHIDYNIGKCNKLIGLIKRLSTSLRRNALPAFYKLLLRSHLDHGNILYDKPTSKNFKNKIEKGQYRACLATTSAIKETSRKKRHDELGLESLGCRRWYKKLLFFYKTVNNLFPEYLQPYLKSSTQNDYPLRSN